MPNYRNGFARSGSDRIRLEVPGDVRYWAGLWGITDDELRDAIAEVGPIAGDVAVHLNKPLEDEAEPFAPMR